MGDDQLQRAQPQSAAEALASVRSPMSSGEGVAIGGIRRPMNRNAVARADQRQRRDLVIAMQTRAGNRAVSRWADARPARRVARAPKLDFYQNAFYANRFFAKDPALPPGWPYDEKLRTLWDAAAAARTDEQSGWTAGEFKAFADAVRQFQVDTMSLSQKDANGAVDAKTARALKASPSPEPEPAKPQPSGDAVTKTVEWLRDNKKTAQDFFDSAWAANQIVLLGENHDDDDLQRVFAADMVYAHGGAGVAVALEIDVGDQAKIDHYLAHGQLPEGTAAWWTMKPFYKSVIDAAASTNTPVIAMDKLAAPADRDAHMAGVVENLALQADKVLVLVGADHIQEAGSYQSPGSTLERPARLGEKLGGSAYAIDMGERKHNPFPTALRAAFPSDTSIGFDVDSSPLREHSSPSSPTMVSIGASIDGYIYLAE